MRHRPEFVKRSCFQLCVVDGHVMVKVLFVTDMMLTGRSLQNMLGDAHRIDAVHPGKGVLLEDQDIIVFDLEKDSPAHMAEITRLRSVCGFRDIPLLVTVANRQMDMASRAMGLGATGVITKPFHKEITRAALSAALKPVGVKAGVGAGVIKPLVDSIIEVIGNISRSEVTRQSTALKKNYSMHGDISAAMDLSGDVMGTVAITFHQNLAFSLAADLLDCDESGLLMENVNDGVQKIAAMVATAATEIFGDTEYNLNFSPPAVLMGYGHRLMHRYNQPLIVIIFETDSKPFALQLCIATAAQAALKNETHKTGKKPPVGSC